MTWVNNGKAYDSCIAEAAELQKALDKLKLDETAQALRLSARFDGKRAALLENASPAAKRIIEAAELATA